MVGPFGNSLASLNGGKEDGTTCHGRRMAQGSCLRLRQADIGRRLALTGRKRGMDASWRPSTPFASMASPW
eukprot:10855983-Alexandrium_andersonii.AAC.1